MKETLSQLYWSNTEHLFLAEWLPCYGMDLVTGFVEPFLELEKQSSPEMKLPADPESIRVLTEMETFDAVTIEVSVMN